jgi:hypothetical protein
MRRKGEKETGRKRNRGLAVKRQSRFLLVSFSPFLLFLIIFPFLFSPLNIYAATLAQYREKIISSETLIEDLLYIDEEDLTPNERSAHESEIIAELRQNLPASEKVEWKGNSIETNNQWLQDKLNEYEKDRNLSKREAILSEISERLATIRQKLDELEKPSVSNRTKDEDKRKLGEILRREEYQKPEKQEKSWLRKKWEELMEWLFREAPRADVAPSSANFESVSFVMQILLYAVVLGLIGFLIYRFAPFLKGRFKRKKKSEKKERVILGERIGADESADNIFSEAERLAREGNLRDAIRKGYIALLCELSDRKIIGLSRHKTNRDYLRDVRKRRELYENMNGLTSNFERHWYGSEEALEKDWEEFRSGYRKAVSSER